MSKQKNSGGNMLLLAGLGVGAFMLFANKSNAQSNSSAATSELPAGSADDSDIPAAPKILAVNSSDTESPTPTAIVSDEDGMEATASASPDSSGDSPDDDGDSSSGYLVTSAGTSRSSGNSRQSQGSNIPPLISTRLTAKEKAIIDKGVLSDELAIQRPDLYKAIYIRKHRGTGQKVLLAADLAIQAIQGKGSSAATAGKKKKRKVTIRLHPATATMVKAAAQANGNAVARQPVKKTTVHHPAGSKGGHPHKALHPTAHHTVTKHPAAKHHPATVHRKPTAKP